MRTTLSSWRGKRWVLFIMAVLIVGCSGRDWKMETREQHNAEYLHVTETPKDVLKTFFTWDKEHHVLRLNGDAPEFTICIPTHPLEAAEYYCTAAVNLRLLANMMNYEQSKAYRVYRTQPTDSYKAK